MNYTMHLDEVPFHEMATGKKTIELRLYDEKRRNINVGDTIIFISRKNEDKKLNTIVTGLKTFSSLKEVKDHYSTKDLGSTFPVYPLEQQKKYGFLAIKISPITSSNSLTC